jgi:sigma-B regulation protein RsbU (phosphoserine phosphatase)
MSKILVIEDEALIRESICDVLILSGYDTVSEPDGELGLKRANSLKPDLVLCDINMPKISGLDVLKAIRADEQLKHTPFVFLTAHSTMADFRVGMNLGAEDYLTKPHHNKDLLAVVSYQLKKAEDLKNIEKEHSRKKINDFKVKIKEQTKGFYDSLNRAKTVQNVILPSDQKLNELFAEHFNYFLPKYSVSGDFYWAKKLKEVTLIAVADCTGHGIPGALISMASNISLNNAVDQFGLTKPEEILTKANELFLDFMNANESNISNDGMDICLCSIDSKSNIIRFAGAKRPLYLVTKKDDFKTINVNNSYSELTQEENTLYEIKGNNCSVGAEDPIFKVQEHVFEYNSGDTIYLSSDGYVDQFGGESDRKFKSKRLKNIVLSVQGKSMSEQKEIFAQEFQNWKGDKEQIDDVCFIGISL